jgi:hypothetical protein
MDPTNYLKITSLQTVQLPTTFVILPIHEDADPI